MGRAFAILLLVFVTSCASIFSRNEVISVDSKPRNIAVVEKGKDTPPLKTPFVNQFKRKRTLTLLSEYNGVTQEHSTTCGFRWIDSGVGNLVPSIFFGAGIVYALPVLLGLDLLSGAAFDCPEALTLNIKPEEKGPEICRKYLILPPEDSSLLVSEEVEVRGMERLKAKLEPCDSIVPVKETDALFTRFEISNRTKNREFSQFYYNYWAREFGANTIVDFRIQKQGSKLEITPHYLDIHSHEKRTDPVFSIDRNEVPALSGAGFTIMDIGFRFLPNAVGFGFDQVSPEFEGLNGYTVESQTRKGTPIFFELGSRSDLASVQDWNFSTSWSVNYPLFYEKFHIKLVKDLDLGSSTPGSSSKPTVLESDWIFIRVMSEIYGDITIHTPVGAFSAGLGVAPGYFYTSSSERVLQDRIYMSLFVHAYYEAFISQSLYFFAGAETTSEAEIKDDYSRRSSLTRLLVGIEYLLPRGIYRFQ